MDAGNHSRGLEEAQDILEFNTQMEKVDAWIRDKVRVQFLCITFPIYDEIFTFVLNSALSLSFISNSTHLHSFLSLLLLLTVLGFHCINEDYVFCFVGDDGTGW